MPAGNRKLPWTLLPQSACSVQPEDLSTVPKSVLHHLARQGDSCLVLFTNSLRIQTLPPRKDMGLMGLGKQLNFKPGKMKLSSFLLSFKPMKMKLTGFMRVPPQG